VSDLSPSLSQPKSLLLYFFFPPCPLEEREWHAGLDSHIVFHMSNMESEGETEES